jgi:hypothetical protein
MGRFLTPEMLRDYYGSARGFSIPLPESDPDTSETPQPPQQSEKPNSPQPDSGKEPGTSEQ